MNRLLLLACVASISVLAQQRSGPVPRFEDYPATEIHGAALAAPKIMTPVQRKYRTRIREGVEKGWGVRQDGKEQNHPGPNFAGKMVVVQWGCGAPCLMMAVVDGETGEVFLPPLAVERTFTLPMLCVGNSVSSNPQITFRRDSRLMVVKATPDCSQMNHHSYAHYFLWQDNHWKLLFREPLD
ncbi:MAG: hypothetical protein SFV54_12900 [Bryobacteraceae bacterium]|nr:hypothetical protein [Bryobacteraceae bacterium]